MHEGGGAARVACGVRLRMGKPDTALPPTDKDLLGLPHYYVAMVDDAPRPQPRIHPLISLPRPRYSLHTAATGSPTISPPRALLPLAPFAAVINVGKPYNLQVRTVHCSLRWLGTDECVL